MDNTSVIITCIFLNLGTSFKSIDPAGDTIYFLSTRLEYNMLIAPDIYNEL